MKAKYKLRSGFLRKILKQEIFNLTENEIVPLTPATLSRQFIIIPPFGATYFKDYEEWYVYNALSGNVICTARYRHPEKEIILRYRKASIYAPIIKAIRKDDYTVLAVPSTSLGRRRTTVQDRLHQRITNMSSGFKKGTVRKFSSKYKEFFDSANVIPVQGTDNPNRLRNSSYMTQEMINEYMRVNQEYVRAQLSSPFPSVLEDRSGRLVRVDSNGRYRYMNGRFATMQSIVEARSTIRLERPATHFTATSSSPFGVLELEEGS